MTDKVQKIREEVEKLMYGFNLEADIASCEDAETEKLANTKYQLCKKMLDYIDEIQKEPVSEELEEASKEWLRPQLDKSYANYGEAKMMELTHFDGYAMLDAIEFGAKWQKEQMMKDAVDGWVFRDIKEGRLRISDNKECWNGIRIPEKSIEKSYLFCTTDDAIKVKLIITKED